MKELKDLKKKSMDRAAALIGDSIYKIEALHMQGGQVRDILIEFANIKEILDITDGIVLGKMSTNIDEIKKITSNL